MDKKDVSEQATTSDNKETELQLDLITEHKNSKVVTGNYLPIAPVAS